MCLVGRGSKRVIDESLACQVFVVEIPAGNTRTADVDFTRDSDLYGVPVAIKNIRFYIPYSNIVQQMRVDGEVGSYRDFGWAVFIDNCGYTRFVFCEEVDGQIL